MKKAMIFLMMLMITGTIGCSRTSGGSALSNEKIEVTVSAAASLQDALAEIKREFETTHPAISIVYNFGSSGALQQQISRGAPVDVFFSAAEDKFQVLVSQNKIAEKANLLGNQVVLIVPKSASVPSESVQEITQAKRLAMGTPASVPAGRYTQEALEALDLWPKVKEKVIYAKDVRQVLSYVETGNVDAGFVYKTDALHSSSVKIIAKLEEQLHAPIIYPAGVLKTSKHAKEAGEFYVFLQSNAAKKIFQKHGFKWLVRTT